MVRTVVNSTSRDRTFIGFSVGPAEYAVPVSAVREVIMPGTVTELPHTPAAIVGVTNHRGAVVPVVDLRVRFGLPPDETARLRRWVLVAVANELVALVVDRVSGVFGMPEASLLGLPDLGSGAETRGILGVLPNGGQLVFVLDLSGFGDLIARLVKAPAPQPGEE